MSFIKTATLALAAGFSLAACNNHALVDTNNGASVSQVEDSSLPSTSPTGSMLQSLTPSHFEAIIGQVTEVVMQDREQQTVTMMDQNGDIHNVSISKSSLGQQNEYQKLAKGDYIEVTSIEVTGDMVAASSDEHQLTVTAMPYVLREIMIADHKVDCIGVAPRKCLLTKPAVQDSSQSEWQYRYSGIDGFDYEPNYEYTLLIKNTTVSNPPTDASSVRSELVEVIKKSKTGS